MLIRGLRQTLTIVGPLLILTIFIIRQFDDRLIKLPFHGHGRQYDYHDNPHDRPVKNIEDSLSIIASHHESNTVEGDAVEAIANPVPASEHTPHEQAAPLQAIPQDPLYTSDTATHHAISSLSTTDKKYFRIVFGKEEAVNPNIIPHPVLQETWIIVAQRQKTKGDAEDPWQFTELVCNATFTRGTLSCIEPPTNLPIGGTPSRPDKCTGNLSQIANNVGPHDARVFYGPKSPYIVYGSNSQHTCFGQWVQDFRPLIDWGYEVDMWSRYRFPTELQRPDDWHPVEKNFFVFWDQNENMYAHYDIQPSRVFAKLSSDGSVGPDLAPMASTNDQKCMAKYIPQFPSNPDESIHQATNSLAVTLCARDDPECIPDESNTYIMTIFHHKQFFNWHGVYEPYVMLFRQKTPFSIYGISRKPIWINGRAGPREGRRKGKGPKPDDSEAWKQTEMVYVTSVGWKGKGQKYQGYVDDVLFVTFGVEDEFTAAIDVTAASLLGNLGLCADA